MVFASSNAENEQTENKETETIKLDFYQFFKLNC